MVEPAQARRRPLAAVPAAGQAPDPEALLVAVGRGDETAFGRLYDLVAARVFGLIRRVVRDPAQAEEVTQEVMVEVWRTATRFDPSAGSATAWVYTIAHRRAVDRVRSEQASSDRLAKFAATSAGVAHDQVAEEVTTRLEHQQVRSCLDGLTELQRQVITLAYYDGRSYREVADLLAAPLPTIKTRMRDGLIRLRDCLGIEVTAR